MHMSLSWTQSISCELHQSKHLGWASSVDSTQGSWSGSRGTQGSSINMAASVHMHGGHSTGYGQPVGILLGLSAPCSVCRGPAMSLCLVCWYRTASGCVLVNIQQHDTAVASSTFGPGFCMSLEHSWWVFDHWYVDSGLLAQGTIDVLLVYIISLYCIESDCTRRCSVSTRHPFPFASSNQSEYSES